MVGHGTAVFGDPRFGSPRRSQTASSDSIGRFELDGPRHVRC